MSLTILNFQNVPMDVDSSDSNELASIKFAIRRALSTLSIGFRGKYTNVKFFFVDLPLSMKAFKLFFAPEFLHENNFKKVVTVDDLNSMFGANWNYFEFPESLTRKRVIGNVQLHFRTKTIDNAKRGHINRYIILLKCRVTAGENMALMETNFINLECTLSF